MRRTVPKATMLATALAAFGIALAPAASAKVRRVHKGDSIQKAINKSKKNDSVVVDPGTYKEKSRGCPGLNGQKCALVIKQKNLALLTKKGKNVKLEAKGGQDNGIGIGKTTNPSCLSDSSKRLKGTFVSGFTIKGFSNNGLYLSCAQSWRITHVQTKSDFEYGIFPSHSVSGRVDHSLASGAHDTGIYVGQSRDVRVDHSTSKNNVSGYEIENSTNVRDDHNEAVNNTGGILSFALPNLDVKTNTNNQIDHNVVTTNNSGNACPEPGDAVCAVPPGTGILILAADTNLVTQNQVTGNKSYGIAVADYCNFNDCSGGVDIDPAPNDDRITSNAVTGNGAAPDPAVPGIFAKDLAWDLSGSGNCWSVNTFGTSFPDPLPSC